MDLVLLGLNHRTAPIGIREKVAFPERDLPDALRRLCADFGLEEAMIISTCNRVELLAGGSPNGPAAGPLREFLSSHHGVKASVLDPHLYALEHEQLVEHVFRVASSLDSMVVGEAQILGQLKQAYSCARVAGSAGRNLARLIPHAFFVAKRVRNETRIGHSSVSISSVAVELAVKIFGELEGKSVLLLGAGKMAELAAKSLLSSGAVRLSVANRTQEKAEAVARAFGGATLPFSQLGDALIASDIVIVSTGAEGYVITRDLVDMASRRRHYNPLFIIDISVPRNVDPVVNEIETAFCYDIDDLQAVVDAHLEERGQEAELAVQIVLEEVHNFNQILERRRVGPVIDSFRRKIEEICLDELEKERQVFASEDYRRLERLMLRAAHRISHPLMVKMKEARVDPHEALEPADLIAEAFKLDEKK